MSMPSTLLASTALVAVLGAAGQASDERGTKGGWGKPAAAAKAAIPEPVEPPPARPRRAPKPRSAETRPMVRLEWPARPAIRLSWDTAADEGLPAVALDWSTERAQ